MDARRYIKVAENTYIDTIGPENARRKVPLAEIVVCLVIVCILATILFPVFAKHRGSSRVSCQSNLKQMGLAMAQYCQDYDGSYPLATMNDVNISEARPYGWADTLQSYIKSPQIYHCPTKNGEHTSNPMELNYTDYWLNGNIFQVHGTSNPSTMFLFGDGNDGHDATNARYSLRAWPSSWWNDHATPVWRHLDGANYCYADGHVKWVYGGKAIEGFEGTFSREGPRP